jgi:DNA mismatch repair ATPase MutS
MSGKSTFLRTIGVNLVLAYAGGPVDAESLEALPFRLFTCISVSDSLSDGISYFYAEVRRLKTLLDELNKDGIGPRSQEGSLPLFFLIDEIFRGTNNRERQIGSRICPVPGGRSRGRGDIHPRPGAGPPGRRASRRLQPSFS